MKILHICLTAPFIDNWGYQENLLPEYLAKSGHDNYIIAAQNAYPKYVSQREIDEITKKGDEYDCNGVHIKRIKAKRLNSSIIIPFALYETIEKIQPDVILHHNVNTTSLPITSRYARKHNIKLFVDNHADEINCSKNRLFVLLYYKFAIKIQCLFTNNVIKYYGVTHSRCDFLHNYYGIPYEKIGFLPIGADIIASSKLLAKEDLRLKYSFQKTDIIVCSGGKMGKCKGTDNLISAIKQMNFEGIKILLLLFGKFEDDTEISIKNNECIRYEGWCNRQKTLELLKLSDMACWPIHHTTLCEDAISVETPLLLKKTKTTEHLIQTNGFWLDYGSQIEIYNSLIDFIQFNAKNYTELQKGCKEMKLQMGYDNIAKMFLSDVENVK